MLKNYILLFAGLIYCSACIAQDQEFVKRKSKLTDSVSEVYTTSKNNKYVKQGLYMALYQKKTAVATGMFDKDVKVGLWRFYNQKGRPLQTYDYTNRKLIYEAPEDTTSDLRYFVDRQLDSTDKVTKPIKVGGRYYGYLSYLRLFTLPDSYAMYPEVTQNLVDSYIELLISPGGRLADLKVHINNGVKDNIIKMSINMPDEEDKNFIPATLNGEPIACRITIRTYITADKHLDFW